MRKTPLRIDLGPAGRKLFRLDQPTHPAVDAEPEGAPASGRLWRRIWKKVSASADERRSSVRHEAAAHEVWVGWASRDQFVTLEGRLVNISRGGALVVLRERPPRDRPLWVYKEVGSTIPSVRGEAVGHTPARCGGHAVRIRFAVPCPTVLCESVVCGPPGKKAVASQVPSKSG